MKVSTAEVNNPDLNFTIVDGKQFKILTLVEKILQAQEDNFEDKQNVENELPFDTSIIRIKVPIFYDSKQICLRIMQIGEM